MTQKSSAPTGLRIFHAIVFLGCASSTLAGAHLELLQLWRALTQPFHSGTGPSAIACASGLVAGCGALLLIARLGLGRTIPLWLSAAMVLSFAGGLAGLKAVTLERTVPGANVKCLEKMKELNQTLDAELKKTAQVPVNLEAFTLRGETPFYRRPFTPLPWRVEKVKRTDALPDGAEPGWLLFRAGADGLSYVIAGVGIDADGVPSLVREDGKPVEYLGTYNPDTTP